MGAVHEMPGIRAVTVTTETGVVSGGHLDIAILDARHPERGIIAARVLGVRDIASLLAGRVHDRTAAAAALGIEPGMTGEEALKLML
jgi:uncharacterized protein YunC (DUF1805 family)